MYKKIFTATLIMYSLLGTNSIAQTKPDVIKIGVILPLTGAFSTTGRQSEAGMRLYMAQHGNKIAGKEIELVIKDDGSVADASRRIAQEMVTQDKVAVLAGFGITPAALAAAPIATRSKTPMVVTAAATSSITEASPFVVRTGFTLPQVTTGIAAWAPKNGIKTAVSLVADYGPGGDAEKFFKQIFESNGGKVISQLRAPVRNPDYAPFLQRVREDKPDAVFVFLPAGQGAIFMKQFTERGLDKAGIRLIATGDVTDDELLNGMGDAVLGVITSHHYSVAHPSALNQKFVKSFESANPGLRPNFMAVGAYDGMHLIYNAVEKTKGAVGPELLEAMKGQAFESPRGMIKIDPKTRDVVQDVYIRRAERVASMNNEIYNVELSSIPAVADPGKTQK